MGSLRVTNGLLAIIALLLLAHLAVRMMDRPVVAETFHLDSCITTKPGDKPASYLHVVSHGMGDE